MNEFTLRAELWLARPRAEVFPFFAEARNLETLKPSWLFVRRDVDRIFQFRQQRLRELFGSPSRPSVLSGGALSEGPATPGNSSGPT
jgi:hypothetical protein